MNYKFILSALVSFMFTLVAATQPKGNDVTTPLHLLKPDYPIPYGAAAIDTVKKVLDRVYNYLNEVTPTEMVDKRTNTPITDFNNIDTNTTLKQGDFRLTSYEWGVTSMCMRRMGTGRCYLQALK